jgi:hypothetical protein
MFRMMRLRLQIKFWKALGRLAIWLRDEGQRAYAWYEQHSPMKIVTDGKPQMCTHVYACPYAKMWQKADEGVWEGNIYGTDGTP